MKMNGKNGIPMRGDAEYSRWLRRVKAARVVNGVDKKFRSDKELMRMFLNCPSMPSIEKELSTIPKREDLRKL